MTRTLGFSFDLNRALGLYVHLPFCASRCGYCDFAVVTEKDDRQAQYVDRLIQEIAHWSSRDVGPLGTLYFGGGTPSRLQSDQWRRLFGAIRDRLELLPDAEISAEANPDSLSEKNLILWNELGINRISLGVQSFQPNYLNLLDRRHSALQAGEAIERLRGAGFENWSLDLIYGLPNQEVGTWMKDLESALSFGPPHLSFYNLILHPNLPVTHAALKARRNDEDEIHAELFLRTVETLESFGYEVYELSNAAQPGMRSRHNSLYWLGGEWIGIGNSASGFFRGTYYSNPAPWDAYLQRWGDSGAQSPDAASPTDVPTALLDTVMLRLRTVEGMAIEELEELGGRRMGDGLSSLVADLEGYGYLRGAPGRISLSPKGWLLHSEITDRIVNEIQKAAP